MTKLRALVAFLVPLFGIWAPTGMTALLVCGCILAVALSYRETATWPRMMGPLAWCLAALGVWAAISLAWAPEFGKAAGKLASLVILVAIGLAYRAITASRPPDATLIAALATGTFLALVSVIIEKYLGAPFHSALFKDLPAPGTIEFLNRFNRGMTVLALFVWPAAYWLGRTRPLAGIALLAATAALIATMQSQAALLALVLGLLVFAGVQVLHHRRIVIWLGACVAVVMLLMPTLVDTFAPHEAEVNARGTAQISVYHRLLIWDFTNARIDERAFVGWGFDSARRIPGSKAKSDQDLAALPLHPHNAALQLRLELGLPGILLGTLALFAVFRDAGRRTKNRERAVLAAMLTGGVTIALLSYGMWQSWWVATLFLVAALMPVSPKDATDC